MCVCVTTAVVAAASGLHKTCRIIIIQGFETSDRLDHIVDKNYYYIVKAHMCCEREDDNMHDDDDVDYY